MKTLTKITFSIIILLCFSYLLFGQEMTPQQKQILEKLKQEEKAEAEKRKQIEKQLGFDKKTDEQKKVENEFIWEKGVGLTIKNIAQERNVSQYIKGGHIDCRDWGLWGSKDDLSLRM